jgi:pimeloyl-ACP methyl ester carboxylesterase
MESQRFVQVDGARLAFSESGAGEAVVLIHGFALDRRMWDDQVPELAKHFRVITYDLRGFGQSSVPASEPYTTAGDLKALLDHLGLERAALVGLSMGGNVAIQFAEGYPEIVRALVLIDAVVGGWSWSPGSSAEDGRAWALGRSEGLEAARDAWLAHAYFVPANEQPAVARRLRQMAEDYSGYHWMHNDPQVWPDPPALARLGDIGCPTLVIVGERDTADLRAMADALAQRIESAKKLSLPGVGHMANMEAPREVNAAILDFLLE